MKEKQLVIKIPVSGKLKRKRAKVNEEVEEEEKEVAEMNVSVEEAGEREGDKPASSEDKVVEEGGNVEKISEVDVIEEEDDHNGNGSE